MSKPPINTLRKHMGAASEIVTVQHERALKPKQVRISRSVRRAVDAMVDEGLRRPDAAKKAGIEDNTLYIALRKPEVLAYRNDRLRVLRESEASRTVAKAATLMDTAASEHVQADMVKWLGGLEGISPVNRTESLHIHQHDVPGIAITFNLGTPAPIDPDPVRTIQGQAREIEKPMLTKHMEARVPHPSERNAAKSRSTPPPGDGTPGGKT